MRLEAGLVIFLAFACKVPAEDERSFLDDFLPIFRVIKKSSSDALRSIIENPRSRRLLRQNNVSIKTIIIDIMDVVLKYLFVSKCKLLYLVWVIRQTEKNKK